MTRVIELNQDVVCKQCGKPGAVKTDEMDDFGICLKCASENISSGFMHIGPKTFGIIQETITRLLNKNRRSIDAAYTANENDLTISISINLKPHQTGNIIVKTGINFVESRVKESLENLVDEKQMELFKGGA